MPTFPVRSPAKMNSPSGCGDVPSGERGGRFKNNSPSSYHLNHSGRLWTCASCPEKSGVNRGFL